MGLNEEKNPDPAKIDSRKADSDFDSAVVTKLRLYEITNIVSEYLDRFGEFPGEEVVLEKISERSCKYERIRMAMKEVRDSDPRFGDLTANGTKVQAFLQV